MLVVDQLRKGDRQLQVLSFSILLGLVILLVGLWRVQIVSAKKYQASQQTQSVRLVRLPSVRGKIRDRNGVALADNRANYAVNLYLDGLRKQFEQQYSLLKADYLQKNPGIKLTNAVADMLKRQGRYQAASNSVARLSALLGMKLDFPEQKFAAHYDRSRSYPLTVLSDLQPQQIARFMEMGAPIPGMDLDIQPLRYYPYQSLATHVLGHVKRDFDGSDDEEDNFQYRMLDYRGETGIEGKFDEQLRGTPGVKSIVINNVLYRQEEQLVAEAQPGYDVWLTIDLALQKDAEAALRASGQDTRGAVVVMDARNGDVLAMVSSPAYDPSVFLARITDEVWERLDDSRLAPQINRAVAGAYNPGSIFKIVTGLACLEANIMTANDIYTKHGPYMLGKRPIKDLAPDGDFDFQRAFIKSSNSYFIHYGLMLGAEKLLALGHQFCLGEKTDLPLTQEVRGEFPEYKDKLGVWSPGNVANVCIGQEITMTPMQAAVMISAVANGGTVFWPRLVQKLVPPEHLTEAQTETFPAGRVRRQLHFRPENLATVHAAMRADVSAEGDNGEMGTGKAAEVHGMDICGKTGTAEIKENGHVVDRMTWFASFAPLSQPRYTVIVIVESGSSGGGTCAPVARKIYEGIQKREQNPPGKTRNVVSNN
ncbi:MAG TPA: penicillin-binding transpeptidase domain-containing protein [Verrucomicrobiae bacterium]|nr:penicillin-binding transpeptidase domain-containing protein [Verrucomicrobiae bacterium]